MRGLSLAAAELDEGDWLAVAGAGEATRVRFEVRRDRRGELRFEIADRGEDGYPESRHTGDGAVPLAAAVGLHAVLPNVNAVQRLVLKHLRPSFRGPVTGHPLPGVRRADWRPPVSGLR